jgi:hypothetical protein
MNTAELYVNTAALAFVALACFLHMAHNVDKHSSNFERLGFAFCGGGALGLALLPWWKEWENFPFDTMMHGGMALIALGLVSGHLRAILASIPGLQFADRRRSRAP